MAAGFVWILLLACFFDGDASHLLQRETRLNAVAQFSCYVCSSKTDSRCGVNVGSSNLTATTCPSGQCLLTKTVGTLAGTAFALYDRSCVEYAITYNGCSSIPASFVLGGSVTVTSCYCSTSGCNANLSPSNLHGAASIKALIACLLIGALANTRNVL